MIDAWPIQHRHVADALYQRGFTTRSEIRDRRVAGVAIRSGHLHFNQFVVFQCGTDFGDHRVGQAFGPDLQHGFEPVGLAAEETILGAAERDRHAGEGLEKQAGADAQSIMARIRPDSPAFASFSRPFP